MTIQELKMKYKGSELTSFPGENKLRYEAFAPLFDNLYESKVVYHERFTGIIKLENIKITPERFEAKAISYLLIEKGNRFDQCFLGSDWQFGAIWSHIRLIGNCLTTPYANWHIWIEPGLVKYVEGLTKDKMFEDALELTVFNKNK